MAKISYSKFKLKTDTSAKTLAVQGLEIEVRNYVPVEERLEAYSRILNEYLSNDDNHFLNQTKMQIYMNVEFLRLYTNISFTEKQLEKPQEIYDQIMSNHLFWDIAKETTDQWQIFNGEMQSIFYNYMKYHESALGIMESIAKDYSNLDLDATKLQEKISNPENLKLLKDVMDKLG